MRPAIKTLEKNKIDFSENYTVKNILVDNLKLLKNNKSK